MAVQQAFTLYPVNTTTVDTGAGIDVRYLATSTGSADSTQTATFTHTNDNVERTFDPATAGVTNTNNANTTMFKLGWALGLASDMTPTDDTHADAFLPAQNVTIGITVNCSQTGGTYTSGTVAPTFRVSLWTYNPATDTGTLIAAGTITSITWDLTPVTGDIGTAKNATTTFAVPATIFGAVKGTAAEVLYLQVGFNTGTVPNPTLGTATYTMTYTVGISTTDIVFASGLAELFYGTGSSTGVGATSGSGVLVIPTDGSSSGAATASGSLIAFGLTTGTSSGVATASGAFGAVGETTGSSSGVATVSGSTAMVAPTVGTVDIGGGGGTTIIKKPIYIFGD